ncbi:putative testis, partial [Fasciolopsis buskii]
QVSLLWVLSYFVIVLYGFILVFCTAAGLLYITELVEEHTVTTGKIIRYLIGLEVVLHVLLFFTDNITYMSFGVGLVAHLFYASLLKQFPAFYISSVPFLGSLIMFVLHHVVAFSMFAATFYPFSEMLAYFTFFCWAVPFMYLVSLSANDMVLPQTVDTRFRPEIEPLLSGSSHDVVSAYLKKKRRSLYSVLSYIRESLPLFKPKKGF